MSEGDYIFSHLFLEFESPSKQYSRLLIFLRSALQIRETACASKHAAMTCSYDTESGLACQEFESKKAETEKRRKKTSQTDSNFSFKRRRTTKHSLIQL